MHVTKEEETSQIIKTILHKEKTACTQECTYKTDKTLCKCKIRYNMKNRALSKEGWEGSAVITHGSIISFGCLMFVFNTLNIYLDR